MHASECKSWFSAADLLGDHPEARVSVIGAPLGERSLTPGRCDLAPKALRAALPRMSTYDPRYGTDLSDVRVHDTGDLALKIVPPAEAFEPIRAAVDAEVSRRELVILLGGNNAITRPGVHGLKRDLKGVGLITLDAHLDLRDTDCGLNNGNPIQALLEDGMEGHCISQIGIAPFANTRRAHEKAQAAGITVRDILDWSEHGVFALEEELTRLSSLVDAIYVDFDIDVIDRSQFPAAPGARPGGMPVQDFFDAARMVGEHPKVRCVDLAEYDPSLDVADIGSLTAARWFVELLAGFAAR